MKKIIVPLLCHVGLIVFGQEFSQRYELVNLGKVINTFYHEAAPVVSQDGKTLYFFLQNHPQNKFGKEGSQDIWVSKQGDNGEWLVPEHLGAPFNQHRSNQVFTALPDGSLFVRGGRGSDGKGFSIVSPSGAWNELVIPGFEEMNKGRFNGASISSDTKHIILYFSEVVKSIRSNLYVSNLLADGKWSRPERLSFSNRSDEYGPFIGPDDKTLYFASDRPAPNRQGGSDIYKATRMDDSWKNWSEPLNLGSPINTAAGDAYFSMDAKGNVFTSRANSRVDGGNLDLFILLPKNITLKVNGRVFDSKTQQPIAAAVAITPKGSEEIKLDVGIGNPYESVVPETSELTVSATSLGYLANKQAWSIPPLVNDTILTLDIFLTPVPKKLVMSGTVFDFNTSQPVTAHLEAVCRGGESADFVAEAVNGQYNREIKELGWYVITASAEGYLNTTDSVFVESEESTPVIKDIYLKKIEVGLTVRLKNIYFDFDKTTLKSESFTELNKVVEFLKQNSGVEIEIAGHTDSKGADEYNHSLSQGRSQSVVDYLISQGIESYRLTAQGYGEEKPIDTNDTEAGRANNRRVEFTVVKT